MGLDLYQEWGGASNGGTYPKEQNCDRHGLKLRLQDCSGSVSKGFWGQAAPAAALLVFEILQLLLDSAERRDVMVLLR